MSIGVTGGGHGEYGETSLEQEQRRKIKELRGQLEDILAKLNSLQKQLRSRDQEIAEMGIALKALKALRGDDL